MKYSRNKGQMKIQEMAFVLVALMIFFVMVGLFYLSIKIKSVRNEAGFLKKEGARETIKNMAGIPEFVWIEDCINCIDLDKAFALKISGNYKELWKFDYFNIKKIYPLSENKECSESNYPNCNTISFFESETYDAVGVFVALCRIINKNGPKKICELGKVYVSGEMIK